MAVKVTSEVDSMVNVDVRDTFFVGKGVVLDTFEMAEVLENVEADGEEVVFTTFVVDVLEVELRMRFDVTLGALEC